MLLVSTLICKETRKQNRFRRFQLNPGGPSKSGRIDSSGNRVSSICGRKHPGNGFGTFTIEPMKVTELVPRVFPILNASPQAVACKWNESHTWSSGKNKEEVTMYDERVTFLQYFGPNQYLGKCEHAETLRLRSDLKDFHVRCFDVFFVFVLRSSMQNASKKSSGFGVRFSLQLTSKNR